jgi:hypothetical protein
MTNQPQQARREPVYDNKKQLDRIVPYIIPGERLFAVYDCKGAGTGFVGITDKRVIFYDQGVFIKHKTMVSIPYSQVIGTAARDDGIVFKTSEMTLITAAGRFSFEFRGAEKAQWAYKFIMGQVLSQARF